MSSRLQRACAHLGSAGETTEALHILTRRPDETSKAKACRAYFFARIHIGLGENNRAIEYLEKAYEEHSHWLIYLHIDPSLDGLRDNARFQDLLRRVGLPALTVTSAA